MSSYQHVLLAIDYSRQNLLIAKKAQQIAAQNNAKLSILHVIEHVTNDNDNLMADLLDAEQITLAEFAVDLGIVEANQWLRAGIPAKEIVTLAQEQAVDLIVIGAHNHQGILSLLGSPSSDTLQRTKCDLLSVHLN
ncbi:MAG: universal stress protein [Methylococcaceae bacterium]|nr:universal stress protein [Methylococcaceae bacterium]